MRKFIARALIPVFALSISACGTKTELQPEPGEPLPVAPVGANQTPAADKLLIPDDQARPERSDEVLKRSEERESDPFDLPPG